MTKTTRLDARYSIRKEWCGYATPRWVARFCGEWIGQAESRDGSRDLAKAHRAAFLSQVAA